jgi:uncharacterized protein (DUF433 family)
MVVANATESAPFARDEHGVLRVGGSRVMLELLVHAFDDGLSAEEIVESYPTLDLADVYAAIAYVLRNRDEIDAYLLASEATAARTRQECEARFPTAELRRRLRERAAAR